MDTGVKCLKFNTSQEAWEGVNEFFLLKEDEIVENGYRAGNELTCYNVYIRIGKAYLDPKFDFNLLFGYKIQKWSSLVRNYVNLNELDIVKSKVLLREHKKQAKYTESMKFINSHGHGKGCLLSLTFIRRPKDPYPVLSMVLRASEVTKRLAVDLLLVQRIGEYVYGDRAHFSIEIFCSNMYQVIESGIMYHSHKNLMKLIKKEGRETLYYTNKAKEVLKKFLLIDVDDVPYKVHKRTIRQLQRGPDGLPLGGHTPMLAKDLKLPNQ